MMYVPKGFAHGFITLTDDAEAFYFVDEFYGPNYERGCPLERPEIRHRVADPAGRALGQGRRLARFRPRLAPHGLSCAGPTMKILFTGGSSFTGYWFVRELAAAGHDVTAVFRGKPARLPRRGPPRARGAG